MVWGEEEEEEEEGGGRREGAGEEGKGLEDPSHGSGMPSGRLPILNAGKRDSWVIQSGARSSKAAGGQVGEG